MSFATFLLIALCSLIDLPSTRFSSNDRFKATVGVAKVPKNVTPEVFAETLACAKSDLLSQSTYSDRSIYSLQPNFRVNLYKKQNPFSF